MDKGLETGGPPSSSSDFVRKLFKMLEDPTYKEIVRWADGGETFVVLENEKFTKTILPKHFKHSNFASFVRQLNKYDFHKIRQNSEDNAPHPYGPNAWEFKHPEFKEHKKDLLDNIKRKAPAPRKPPPTSEDQPQSQQVDLLTTQLIASQQQIQQLTESYNNLAQNQVKLLEQIVQLQKLVKNHEGVLQKVIRCVDLQKRNSRPGYSSGLGNGDIPNDSTIDDNIVSPLREASELLGEFSAKSLPNKELEQMTSNFQLRNDFPMSQNDLPTNSIALQQTGHNVGYSNSNDLENLVYPVGNTNGIDPIHSEHVDNIPYAPPTILLQSSIPEMAPEDPITSNSEKVGGGVKSMWGERKPNILLVEDDKVCARIGTKFLQSFDCGVETAFDGMEAVTKVNHGPATYDLILMDIIMPHLDGVSASVCIKELHPRLPIIAMTSNIRADDIQMYFSHGMDDILPKPFTKEGMLRALHKYLNKNKKFLYRYPNQISHTGDFRPSTSSHSSQTLSIDTGQISASQLKTETLPDDASTTVTTWDPSDQLAMPSPVRGAPPTGYLQQSMGEQFNINSSISHGPNGPANFAPPQQSAAIVGQQVHQRRGHSEMHIYSNDDPPEKRQRIFQHPPGGFTL